MCGRFALTRPHEIGGIALALGVRTVADSVPAELPARYNVAPSQDVLAFTVGRDGARQAEMLRWGLVPAWAKDASIGMRTLNARSETVEIKPSFRDAFRRGRRCLIPADHFYEWQAVEPERTTRVTKRPHAIALADGQPFLFAGLWESWRSIVAPPTEAPLRSCTLLTTTPNALMAPIHDRMPVILPVDAAERWLDPDTPAEALHALLVPYDAAAMKAWAVGPRVGNPRFDDPSLIAPVA